MLSVVLLNVAMMTVIMVTSMLIFIILSEIIPSVITLNVILLNVIVPSVVAAKLRAIPFYPRLKGGSSLRYFTPFQAHCSTPYNWTTKRRTRAPTSKDNF